MALPSSPDDIPSATDARRPVGSFLRSAGLVGLLTLVSRFLGLARDILLATLFPLVLLDAFLLAFTVPNLFRRLFGEGALSAAFVPAFVEKLKGGKNTDEAQRKQAAGELGSSVLTHLVALLSLIAAAGILLCLILLIPGLLDPVGRDTAGLLAVMLPYMVLICAAALVMGMLNALGHYATPAAAPPLLNVTMITAAVGLVVWPRPWDEPRAQMYGMAVAVLVGGVLQLAIQFPPLARRGIKLRPRWDRSDESFGRVARNVAPVVLGVAVFQVNVLVDRLIALWLVDDPGAVSVLFLGNRLVQFPLAIVAVAMATVALPTLSSLEVQGKARQARELLARVLEQSFFLVGPAAVGLAVMAEPVVELLFGHGRFAAEPFAVRRAADVVLFYSMGLVAFSSIALLSRAFYARGDTRTPVRVGVQAMIANLVLNLALVGVLQESGLALASSLAALLQMGLLAAYLWSDPAGKRQQALTSGRRGQVVLLAAAGAGAAAWLTYVVVIPAVTARLNAFFDVVPTQLNRGLIDARMSQVLAVGTTQVAAAVFVTLLFALIGYLTRDAVARRTAGRAAKIALSIVPMAILVHWFVWSLPPDGETLWIPLQRVLAPLAVGLLGYWFFGGLFQLEEYHVLRDSLKRWRRGQPMAEAAREALDEDKGAGGS